MPARGVIRSRPGREGRSVDDFDLDRYLRASKRVDLSGVRWERVGECPPTEAEARCLAYMMDIESHTTVFLRDLLTTRVTFEPEVTAFLSCWAYEELWHGEAFSRFLGEAGWVLAPDHERVEAGRPYPSRVARNLSIRRRVAAKSTAKMLGTMLGSAVFSDFVALHMTWGAANELSTLTAYHRLIARTRNEELVNLLNAVIKDERRHFAFYRAQARLRLGRSRVARGMTRWAMDHLWAIVGTGVRPQSETDFVVTHLFGDAEGLAAAREMDRTLGDLPGMAGCDIFLRAGRRASARRVPATAPGMWRSTPALAASGG
jgi:rubrerythrin